MHKFQWWGFLGLFCVYFLPSPDQIFWPKRGNWPFFMSIFCLKFEDFVFKIGNIKGPETWHNVDLCTFFSKNAKRTIHRLISCHNADVNFSCVASYAHDKTASCNSCSALNKLSSNRASNFDLVFCIDSKTCYCSPEQRLLS